MAMTQDVPSEGGNKTLEVFARLQAVKKPSLEDLKDMVLIEASGFGLYAGLADAAPNEKASKLLRANGREEVAHAHRITQAIKHLYGVNVPVPAPEDNPFYEHQTGFTLTKEMLQGLLDAELGGEEFYEGWASNLGDDIAAELLRQNGREESRHGERIKEVITLL